MNDLDFVYEKGLVILFNSAGETYTMHDCPTKSGDDYRIGPMAWLRKCTNIRVRYNYWRVACQAAVTFVLCKLLPRDPCGIVCRIVLESRFDHDVWQRIGTQPLGAWEMCLPPVVRLYFPDMFQTTFSNPGRVVRVCSRLCT